MYSSILLVATAAITAVRAQNYSTDANGDLAIVPSSVDYDTRLAWCRAQTNSCPQICNGQASPNTCDANTLNYTCVCTDGSNPNISAYDQTIPSFVCAQWKADCILAHPNDLSGQTACQSVTCGDRNASSGDSSSSSSSSMSSATASSTSGGGSSGGSSSTGGAMASSTASSSSSAAAASSTTGAAAALNVAKSYGTGILAAGMLALFGLAL